ncbi:MAG: type I-C CRISPR-associated protein Cas5 [Lachnospiraceae bacterium]|nr:type I-C CRISPR-associated protein Cas5 [Lachnospiraceae bacterium]
MAIKLEVWGDYALFTRPEMKVERVSYDVITPSAARGILEAIYWHPGLRWVVDEIKVCNVIRFTNIRKNEVKATVSARTAKTVLEKNEGLLYMDTTKEIQQRANLLLRDVRYIISAHFVMTEKANTTDNPGKFQDIISRRIRKGQFYHQPYFGCREFPASFGEAKNNYMCPDELLGRHDLGYMLLDMDYGDIEDVKPMFFRAVLRDGVIKIPNNEGEEVVM